MRKLLISLLLAGAVATPALARPHDDNDRPSHADRQQAREESHSDRGGQSERPQFNGGNHFSQPANNNGVQQQPMALRQHVQPGSEDGGHPQVQALRSTNHDDNDGVRNWRGARRQQTIEQHQVVQDRRERFDNDALRHSDRPLPQVMRTRVPVVSTVPRQGTQPPLRVDNHRRGEVRWSTDWRRDRRYDWRDWRNRHRDRFRIGIYYDPFGWGYQPYSIGWRLWPSYYSSRYWINDPWQYRLPYAPPGTRWIRYWNDAILVDEWTGEVVDVLYNFFW